MLRESKTQSTQILKILWWHGSIMWELHYNLYELANDLFSFFNWLHKYRNIKRIVFISSNFDLFDFVKWWEVKMGHWLMKCSCKRGCNSSRIFCEKTWKWYNQSWRIQKLQDFKWLVGKIQENKHYYKVHIEYVYFLLFDYASSHFISGRPH